MSWTVENWDVIWTAFLQHLVLVAQALALSLLISLPLGIWSARRPLLYAVVIAVTGILYTLPALAIFALLIPILGLGSGPALVAIVLYSLLVLTRNVVVGLREVPADVLDAADGMGYGRWRRLWQVEIPLALPLILAGIRLTVVTQISVATVAAFIGAGGLGDLIFQGITQDFTEKVVVGAVVTSLMAIVADEGFRRLELALKSRQGTA